ncbi:uncharacterized protein HD556DRAFT_1307875 [Suillus plorans]|uniref:Uncharacterized protein n=1 Tax=Suillus plorans TaxID=116603 RepID=A0A9P7ARB4_9AGAM|nr:uncharacterized protein HD556DRAFT_1307875 [Suillus plorans]KAG1794881.1 hypothetical protein HD556DRAFT_1307875 [Suillus plorans]
MIQFSKPRRSLIKSMDQFCRHETNARTYIPSTGGAGRSGTPSRFDTSFYRTHDALGYIPSDRLVDLVYPVAPGVLGSAAHTVATPVPSSLGFSPDAGLPSTASIGGSAMAFSQSDRLQRCGSFSYAAGASYMASVSGYDHKSQGGTIDLDDVKSQYAGMQSGVTNCPAMGKRVCFHRGMRIDAQKIV